MVDWRLPEGNLMDEVPMKEIVGHLSNSQLKEPSDASDLSVTEVARLSRAHRDN